MRLRLGALAKDVKLAVELLDVQVFRTLSLADENLFDPRLGLARQPPDGAAVRRHFAPAQHAMAFLSYNPLDHAVYIRLVLGLLREKNHPDAVLAGGRQIEAQCLGLAGEELVRHLDQQPSAVARIGVTTASPPVGQVDEDFEALLDDLVRRTSLDVGDEADSAGVMLVPGVVQPLPRR